MSDIEKEKDKCVKCNEPTKYTRDTPIHLREGYIEGAGQLCAECFRLIYSTPADYLG